MLSRLSDREPQVLVNAVIAEVESSGKADRGTWSSSQAPSLAPSPLRTGLEGFPFIRLEHSKTPP
jgi:hypothetical protein